MAADGKVLSSVRDERWCWLAIVLVTATVTATLWPELSVSLSTDELLGAWVVKGGLRTALGRALEFQGQPLFFAAQWGITRGLGSAEWVLRLLSLGAMILTPFVLARVGMMHWGLGPAGVVISSCVFLGIPDSVAHGVSARPYAFANLLTVLSVMAFFWWERRPDVRRGAAYAALLAAILYTHYLYGVFLIVHLTLAVTRRVPARAFGGVGVLLALMLLPLVPHLVLFTERWSLYAAPVSSSLSPGEITLLIALACLAALAARTRLLDWRGVSVLSWAVGGQLFFLVAGLVTVFPNYSRYYGWQVAGIALAAGLVVERMVSQPGLRVVVAAAAATLGLTSVVNSPPPHEEWREAYAALPVDRSRVLLWSGLLETRDPGWLQDETRAGYLTASAEYYGYGIRPVVLASDLLSVEGQRHTATALNCAEAAPPRYVLVRKMVLVNGEDMRETWLSLLRAAGAEPRLEGDFRGVLLFRADCPAPRRRE